MNAPKTAIIYLCWADEPAKYLVDALEGIARQSYARQYLSLVIVYNGPREGEESQIDFIRDEVNKRLMKLPETNILEPGSNVGFSAGNNFGAQYAVEHGADYVLLHNADGYLEDNAVSELVSVMESDKAIGECQLLILLHPEKNLINSAGNELNYLGIGYCARYRESARDFPDYTDVDYVSGAAALMRADLLKKFGFWSNDFFLYHEDTEYSMRLKVRGYKIGLAGRAVFFHKYQFSNKPNKYFWIERNRHALKLIFYKWPTLVLLLPLEILYNLGLLVLSMFNGWLPELIKVYKYWLIPANWRGWLAQRKIIQNERTISDRQIISQAAIVVGTGDLKLPGVISGAINIVFTIYYFLLKILIWW
jgi:GT2 family glycosyltransferase